MSIRICSRKEESLGFRSNYKMASRNFLVATLLTIIVCAATTPATADSIHGCGGFVEASRDLIKSRKPTDAKLDYSHITVELRTLDGLVKDRTQCAPNGYYFIPVYDKGSFLIKVKGPEGWSWDPDQVQAVVDHSGCNGNEDINFRFTGFTVSGRVVGAVGGESCPLKSGGPSNVNIELVSLSGDLVSSVLTSSAGVYLFANILPGKYTIRASRHDLVIQVKGSSEVEVGFGNVLVDDILFVPGYDIRGSVVAQGNPILGVHMYLYSDDVLEVDCPQGSGIAPGERKPLCHALSDADGMFTFKSIPCGVYELVPYYKGENTIFDVSPPSTSVLVQHDHATVLQPFQVTGFSLGGRVVDGSGMGVDGVKIIVDGNHRFVTDRGGYYKLDQVTSKRYTIEAEKEHYKFESLKDFLVLPNMASIDDIKAISYDVCGVVRMVSSDYIAKVALTHGPENVKPQVKHIDENGNFCFEVPSGEYRLSSFAATSESAPELLFLPLYVDVMVNSPILNIEFYQAQVNIHGSVACKEECDSSVSIDLIRLDGKSKDARNTVSLVDKSSEFLFPNVLPGKYRLEVKHNLPGAVSGKDKWCWEQNFVNVNVGTEDVKDIVFVQKGYWVDLISTHDVDAYLTQPHGQHLDLKIKKGSQRTCVESPGPHELHFVNSCIFFGSLSMEIDTSSPLPVYLKAEKYLIKGQIYVEASSVNAIAKLPEDILVELLNDEGAVAAGTNARLVANGNDQTSDALYEYSVWANPGEKLTFVPWDVRENGEEKILFYPKLLHFPVIQDGCQTTVPTFTGRLGLYIKGSVSPPLSDVNIRVIAAEDSLNAALKKGELALETNTGVDGLFVGGPLYDDTTYITEASKPGYHVKAVGPHSFSCQKLGQISVRIYSKEDGNELFASVLLSLSGEDGYRNNSVTGAAGFLFDNLFPGSFYLRPLLKEYAFSPPAQAIELASGESREVIFQATRVAYSAMGLVTLLSGQPKEGVPVEARAESEGYYEETVTDSSGTYRLRGLQPGTTYVVKVTRKGALDNDRIERASPESFVIKVGSEDIRGLDFLVFEQPEITLLSGHVKGERLKELHAHLYVEIRSASDPSRILSAFPLPLSNFFQVKDLPKSKHLLQLRSSLPSSTLRFESEVIEVDLEKNTQVHVGPIGYKVEDDHHKQELTPAPVYPLIAGVLVIALLFSMPRLKDLYPVIMAAATSGSTSTVKKEAKKLVVRKKTY